MPLPIRIAINIDFGKSWTHTFVLYTVDVAPHNNNNKDYLT